METPTVNGQVSRSSKARRKLEITERPKRRRFPIAEKGQRAISVSNDGTFKVWSWRAVANCRLSASATRRGWRDRSENTPIASP
jgi:hypothetical protein